MKNDHKMPKDIFVKENSDTFSLVHRVQNKLVGGYDFDILHKSYSGTNAKFTAEEICNRYNTHEDIVNALQVTMNDVIRPLMVSAEHVDKNKLFSSFCIIEDLLQKLSEEQHAI